MCGLVLQVLYDWFMMYRGSVEALPKKHDHPSTLDHALSRGKVNLMTLLFARISLEADTKMRSPVADPNLIAYD